MQLKKLYINSFKTFAGKFEFDFKEGITAVVGPNGSGKSNLSDAIRWALGEQSIKLLRGSTMSDVIFSGTSSRKQSGMAEVSIVIDNRDRSIPLDFDEVSVTRRVFRDGESHFLMNNIECRLRDIADMFAGTGLGKETYAAIEQGKVDAIISSQPSDRRGIFDEASGIMRYKNRKKEAEKKLADVDERTGRATDIVEELSSKSPVLLQQAEAAHKFKEAKSELGELEFAQICSEVTECRAKLEESHVKLDDKAELRARAEKEIAHQEELYESLRLKISELELGYETCYMKSQAASSNSNKHELSLKDRKAELSRNAIFLERASSDENGLRKSIAEIDLVLRDRQDAAKKARASKNDVQEELKRKTDEIEAQHVLLKQLDGESEKFRSEHFELVSKVASMRSMRGSLIERLKQSSSRKERLTTLLSELGKEGGALDDLATTSGQMLRKKQEEALELKEEIAKAAENIAKKKEDISILEGNLKSQESELARKEATLAGLENLQAEHEGYAPPVKSILAAKDSGRLPGIVSTVGDAIQVPEAMISAIEASLGGQINDLICLTADNSMRAVEYLKEKKLGRATFLPLDIIRPVNLSNPEKLQLKRGFIGIASKLIGFDAQIKPAIEYLLGNTAVFDTLESAIASQKDGFRVRSVTLEGELITSGGAVTGGTRLSDQSSVLKRKNRLSSLGKEIGVLNSVIKEQKAKFEEFRRAIAVLEFESSAAQKDHKSLEAIITGLASDLMRAETQRNSILERKSLIEAELKGLEADDGKHDAEILRLAEEISGAERQALEHEEKNLSYKIEKAELEARIALIAEDTTKLQVVIAREEEALKSIESDIESLKATSERNREELTRLDVEKRNLTDAISRIEGEIAAESGLAAGFAEEASKYAAELDSLKKLKDELANSLIDAESALKTKRRRLASAQASENEASIAKAMLTGEFEALSDRLKKDHGITFEDIAEEERKPIDREASTSRIEELRQLIDGLGDVNLRANEELEELNLRLEFMKGQIDDLDKARTSLYQVIKEAERTARKQFLEMFDQIRVHFRGLFERLFEGGQADIVMIDPEDPLESGIEIICRPPGKKLSQLSLLSGGEKALAAIALVFSFLKVRPAPFCILDEIDAALDDANLDRFKELVIEYSKNSQMIIITHRRSTMESATRVYGVTMEEQGVSKSVCIDTSQIQFQEGIV